MKLGALPQPAHYYIPLYSWWWRGRKRALWRLLEPALVSRGSQYAADVMRFIYLFVHWYHHNQSTSLYFSYCDPLELRGLGAWRPEVDTLADRNSVHLIKIQLPFCVAESKLNPKTFLKRDNNDILLQTYPELSVIIKSPGCVLGYWAVIALRYSPKAEHDGDRRLDRRPRRRTVWSTMMHDGGWLDPSACCRGNQFVKYLAQNLYIDRQLLVLIATFLNSGFGKIKRILDNRVGIQ